MPVDAEWQKGVERVTAVFSALTEGDLERLRPLCQVMMAQKREMQSVVARVDAAIHCAGCGGACCVKGRYHFTAVDLLVYLIASEPLFAPLFDNGLCPYLAPGGCLMAPGYRPFNCITFNCERIEDLLTADEVARFYQLECELRQTYAAVRVLFPDGSMGGAVLR